MKNMKVILAALTLVSASGCGSHEGGKGSSGLSAVANSQVSMSDYPALRNAVLFDSGDAALAFVGNSWGELTKSSKGVRGLKAGPRGSVVRIGEAKLWLRSGSHLLLGQNTKGDLVIDLQKGQARLQSGQGGVLIVGGQAKDVNSSDVLMSHSGAQTMMLETQRRPMGASWSLELDRAPERRGVGSLDVGDSASRTPLQLRSLAVSVQVADGMAITEVEHIFYNPSDERREGTFRFPAPDGVMVTGLAMEMNGRLMEGEFVERVKARQVYEQIVDEMQDPALLEWQQGGWFKLRVFPIEANSEKRVVLRYAAPLAKSIEGYEYRYLATPPEQAEVGHFQLSLNGKIVTEANHVRRATDVVLPFPETAMPRVAAVDHGDYSYAALTILPEWKSVPTPQISAKRQVIIAADSSRSALENRELSIEVLRMVLAELSPQDEFAFFAHDIAPREIVTGFVTASPENISKAIAFYSKLELDGASDLDATLRHAAEIADEKKVQVIYVGDGTPSWGKIKEAELVDRVAKLKNATLFAAVLGRGASLHLWENLTGGKGGRVIRPHTAMEARKLAFFLAKAPEMARMDEVSIEPMENVSIFPVGKRTLFAGSEMTVLLRAPKGKMPTFLTMNSIVNGTSVHTNVAVVSSQKTPGALVEKRFASREIEALQREGADKETVVELSRTFGVLSKYTSLLVLESEEAYKEHQITRQKELEAQRVAANSPQVTGGDLDSLNGREASLSPNHIQPGDPEIRIPAPADARSVVLVFPFGDTKLAHYDAESRSWIARFLISSETADGEYWVRVRVEHADGHIEDLQLAYTVDTSAPAVVLSVVSLGQNRYRFVVRQEDELDAIRVELELPWGQTRRIYRKQEGLFRGVIRAPMPLGESVMVRIVVTDKALNQRVVELEIPVENR